jgi:hypothetical protein
VDAEAKSYVERRFAAAEIAADPFPHICIRDVLPISLYDDMSGALPAVRANHSKRGKVSCFWC